MTKVISIVTNWLIKSKAIDIEDKENYEYAVFCFLITFLPLVIVMIIGSIIGIFFESVLFILPFMLLRKFSGGFHLKSSNACMVFSTILLAMILVAVKSFICIDIGTILTVLVLISIATLMKNSPIDSEERNLSLKEKSVYKKIVIGMSVIIFVFYSVMLYYKAVYIAIPVGCGVFTTAMLQIPCIIKSIIRQK